MEARIARLKERFSRAGDANLAPDELRMAIDRAEAKRAELLQGQPEAKATAKILRILPKAAEKFRKEIEAGLEGDAVAAARARAAVSMLIDGEFKLTPDPETGVMVAHFGLNRLPLLRAAGIRGTGSSGGVICAVPSLPQSARLK